MENKLKFKISTEPLEILASFTREELQDIRDRASQCAPCIPNALWQEAYRDLARAADRLDAMEARTLDIDNLRDIIKKASDEDVDGCFAVIQNRMEDALGYGPN